MRSRWCSAGAPLRTAAAAVAALIAGLGAPAALGAQEDGADRACRDLLVAPTVAECRLAVGAARVVQPRMAAALWGGNPVPGTASTLGMRLGSLPRISLALQANVAPTEIPPVRDRWTGGAERAVLVGLTADAAVGLLGGFSPLPTVGGVLSLDLIGRAAYLPLPRGRGFHDRGAWGLEAGARLGLLRESFTLPGLSLTGSVARVGAGGIGDPGGATDGFFRGPLTHLGADLAATKRVGLVGVTGAVAFDRYSSDLEAGFRPAPGSPQVIVRGEAVHDRWSAYTNLSWTLLVLHGTLELGWQQAPVPDGIPGDVEVDPVGWFGGLSFRLSI